MTRALAAMIMSIGLPMAATDSPVTPQPSRVLPYEDWLARLSVVLTGPDGRS